ncbi:MAG: carboxypeptidase regulatory-like domain-containing protein [Candidatus Cloacimonadaceae bacterium]|nr:carboxypeptidase regulatory-like domain-containing protein [Candidatus Cloacimonadaceae bacterium]
MKKTLLSVMLLLVTLCVFAEIYTIGSKTSASVTNPYYAWYDYNWNKDLYTQAEINAAGLTTLENIIGTGFFVDNTANLTQVFNLVTSNSVIVSGTVVGSDQPTVGLADATITLTGIENYSATTNAQGVFSIPGVLSGNTYNYIIVRDSYQNLSGSVTVPGVDHNMGTLILNEIAMPPTQVVAEENITQTRVTIIWQPPGASEGSLLDSEFDHSGLVPSANRANPLEDFEWANTYNATNYVVGEYSRRSDRILTGYKVWRLLQGQETNEASWTLLTPAAIIATAYQDNGWQTLPDGTYKWAVKAEYTGGAMSIPAFSNPITLITLIGTVAGIVRNLQYSPIMGATVTCGDVTATTNASGAYSMQVETGAVSVTASHPNYASVTQTCVIVVTGQTTTVNFQLQPIINIFHDDFESYEDFAIAFAPWTLIDVDMFPTYGIENVSWPNAYEPMAYIIFNPSATTPPITTVVPHGGSKMAACFASTEFPNNDWLITPLLPANTWEISFWAKSFTAEYGLERMRVGVSTSTSSTPIPQTFNIISGAQYLEVPVEWTHYVFSLASYYQPVRVGIRCVSDDAFAFFVDDFNTIITPNDDNTLPEVATALHNNYPNPFNPETTISYSVKDASPVKIEIYNVKGQLVKTLINDVKDSGNHSVVWKGIDNNNRAVSSGVYYYKMSAGKYSSTKKMILMK